MDKNSFQSKSRKDFLELVSINGYEFLIVPLNIVNSECKTPLGMNIYVGRRFN